MNRSRVDDSQYAAPLATASTTWEALAKIPGVRLRSWCDSNRSRQHASISLHSWNRHRFASFTARQRRGETIEAMVWRAIVELQRRELEGMPKPSAREVIRRRNRKLLDSADRGNPM